MTPVELLKEIEAFLCFNVRPNAANTTALRHSIQTCLEKYENSDFQVMQEMSAKDMDIRVSPYFVEAKLAKGGGHVTMGVDRKVIDDLMDENKLLVALYLMDSEQFKKIKNGKIDG